MKEEKEQKMTSERDRYNEKELKSDLETSTPSKTSACRQRMSVIKTTNEKNDMHDLVKTVSAAGLSAHDVKTAPKLKS